MSERKCPSTIDEFYAEVERKNDDNYAYGKKYLKFIAEVKNNPESILSGFLQEANHNAVLHGQYGLQLENTLWFPFASQNIPMLKKHEVLLSGNELSYCHLEKNNIYLLRLNIRAKIFWDPSPIMSKEKLQKKIQEAEDDYRKEKAFDYLFGVSLYYLDKKFTKNRFVRYEKAILFYLSQSNNHANNNLRILNNLKTFFHIVYFQIVCIFAGKKKRVIVEEETRHRMFYKKKLAVRIQRDYLKDVASKKQNEALVEGLKNWLVSLGYSYDSEFE